MTGRVTEAGPPSGRSPAGDALTEIVLATFALNGRFLAAAEVLARPVGLTAARWQVLGAVLREPRTVSGIARVMGLTRQSVQRLADVLVEQGLAQYLPNPAHRRAMLLTATPAGLDAVRAIHDDQVAWADRVTSGLDAGDLRTMLATMERLIDTLDRAPVSAGVGEQGGQHALGLRGGHPVG
jgi:DNA-binding MarR family transcriptional regulator